MAVLVCAALLAPSSAAAAGVINGDFETGNLQGWNTQFVTEAGNWFAYKGTEAPISSRSQNGGHPLQPPPQGRFAATTDEIDPDTMILWQDIEVPVGIESRLSLLAYYNTYSTQTPGPNGTIETPRPLAVPTPDTLSVSPEVLMGQENRQFRIDVINPAAPLETLEPGDILSTLFATATNGPGEMKPTRFSANLSAFAGQTVRLRIANSVTGELFNAGIDEVALETAPFATKPKNGGAGGKSERLVIGKATVNPKNGTAALKVSVPEAGLLTATSAAKKHKPIRAAKKRTAGATTVKLALKPTAAALKTLALKHRLRTKVAVRFTAKAGGHESATVPITLKLTPRHR